MKLNVKSFDAFSATDESLDIEDVAQLTIFICGVDETYRKTDTTDAVNDIFNFHLWIWFWGRASHLMCFQKHHEPFFYNDCMWDQTSDEL